MFPTSDLDAVQRDIEELHNLTTFHTISLKDIPDSKILGQYDIFHGTNLIIIIILAIKIGGFVYVAKRKPDVLFRCCPFLFSSQSSMRPSTSTFQTRRPLQSRGQEETVVMSQLETTQPEGVGVNESDPLGQTEGTVVTPGTSGMGEEEAYVPGTSEGGAFATIHPTRAPSPHYKAINRVLPVTPPHKPKRGVRLVLPPVRYTGEEPVYAPASERGLLDDEGYIIPSSSYPGSI